MATRSRPRSNCFAKRRSITRSRYGTRRSKSSAGRETPREAEGSTAKDVPADPARLISSPQPRRPNVTIGTVKWFNAKKGYGFIQPENGGPDVFVHISAVERAGLGMLQDGQRVDYEEQRDAKRGKSSAENLKRV